MYITEEQAIEKLGPVFASEPGYVALVNKAKRKRNKIPKLTWAIAEMFYGTDDNRCRYPAFRYVWCFPNYDSMCGATSRFGSDCKERELVVVAGVPEYELAGSITFYPCYSFPWLQVRKIATTP